MSVSGKKKSDWVARTFCDFGDVSRRDVLTNHYSIKAANRAFEGTAKIYSRFGRVWQEDREGKVINDEPQ